MLVKKKKEKPQGAWPSQKCKEFAAIGMFYCLFSIDWDSIHTICLTFSVISHVEMSLEVTVGFNGAFLWMHE